MPLSRLDLPVIRAAVSDLHRILEQPTPTNEAARRVYEWANERTMLGKRSPEGVSAWALIQAGVEWVLSHFADHLRPDCPEITDSQLDQKTKVALLDLREPLLSPCAARALATDAGEKVRFMAFLEDVLARIGTDPPVSLTTSADSANTATGTRRPTGAPARHPDKPSKDRQNDILATITAEGMPLTRPELVGKMKMKTEGKLGPQLAWMVANGILINIPQRGYWPVGQPVPE